MSELISAITASIHNLVSALTGLVHALGGSLPPGM